MTDEEKAEEYADKILFDSKYPFIFSKEKVKAYIIKVYLDSLEFCEEAYNKGLAEGRKELEEKNCELLGIIQGKGEVIQELEKENAELDCQMNRNKYCYSCVNATDRCFKNEIGCPCEKYKS